MQITKKFLRSTQSKLPKDGLVKALPNAAAIRRMPDQFHDHVVARVRKDWRYWVFVHIMGHFVHSFEQVVTARNYEDLETTGLEWVANNLSLSQLRKGIKSI